MAGRRVDRLRVARGRTISAAVVRRAQMRTTFENLARDLDVRLTRIEAIGLGRTAWIFRDAAGFRCVSLVLGRIPVVGPFPDIANHVVETIAVWRKCLHRRSAFEAARAPLVVWKLT